MVGPRDHLKSKTFNGGLERGLSANASLPLVPGSELRRNRGLVLIPAICHQVASIWGPPTRCQLTRREQYR
ncbi:hypothetical protein FOBRF1_000317 [Fusarium oxysporum]